MEDDDEEVAPSFDQTNKVLKKNDCSDYNKSFSPLNYITLNHNSFISFFDDLKSDTLFCLA